MSDSITVDKNPLVVDLLVRLPGLNGNHNVPGMHIADMQRTEVFNASTSINDGAPRPATSPTARKCYLAHQRTDRLAIRMLRRWGLSTASRPRSC